jgi:N-acetylmuramoyl-L-alanine amidase
MNSQELAVYGNPIPPFTPRKVGIQIGHWQRENAPEELAALRFNSGANVPGYSEAAVMYDIGVLVKEYLENEGVEVDLLPVLLPVDYKADAFISLHADGSPDASISGFKIASARTDFSGRSVRLKEQLDTTYAAATGFREDGAITRRMTGYYAFNWRRYDHAVHPQTPAIILETGFLSNISDRTFLIESREKVARGIADGVLAFLAEG